MEFLTRFLPLLSDPLILGSLAALVAAAGLYSLLYGPGTSWLSRIQRKALLTANEMEFYRRLERALPAYRVFPQVSFAAFLTDDGRLSGHRSLQVAGWAVVDLCRTPAEVEDQLSSALDLNCREQAEPLIEPPAAG